MSAIDFVVRDAVGNLQRGSVAGDGVSSNLIVGSGQDVSLNLRRTQIRDFERQGQALEVTLIDGRVITIEGFFTMEGGAENQLFISADGLLAEVMLTNDGTGNYYAQYVDADSFGKWSPQDDLYFVRGNDVMMADAGAVTGGEVGMLAAPLLGGIGGLGSLLGLGGAAVGTAVLVGGGDDGGGGSSDPFINVSSGVDSANHVVNEEDLSDGVDIGGEGEPGATVVVTVDGVSHETVVGADGTWTVQFSPEEIATGEYSTDINVTITNEEGGTASATETLVVDTIANLEFSTGTTEVDGQVNADEMSDGVVLTGTSEAGSTVVVTIEGVEYAADVAADGSWTVNLSATDLAGGEYTATLVAVSTDPYGNTSTITQALDIDTETTASLSSATIAGDGTVNQSEHAEGVVLNGTAEAGASVVVTMGGVAHTVTADADGNWTTTYTSAEVAEGTYTAEISVIASDLAGNTASTSGTVNIDTEMTLSVDTASVETDGVVNALEQTDGITLTGTAEAGATVAVTLNGFTHTVTADANGNWSSDFVASEVPTGTYDAPVSVTATDGSGNVETVTSSVQIDTEASVTFSAEPVEGDNVVNAAEVADGATLTGSTEAGSTVVVEMNGTNYTAQVDASGNWSVAIPAAALAAGEYTASAVATATDAYGNTASETISFEVDTVTNVTVATAGIEGDGIVNAVERTDGITLTGSSEEGATVVVSMNGATRTVVAGVGGAWSADFASFEVPTGETTAAVSVTATDAAGNTATATDVVNIDTLVTNFDITGAPVGGDGVVNAAEAAQGISLSGTTEVGSQVTVSMGGITQQATVDAAGNWSVSFASGSIPDGEYTTQMVVNATDIAGNTSTMTESVQIDTVAGSLALSAQPIETDGVVNYQETQDGVVIHGTSDPGEVVTVTLGGVSHQVVTGSNGLWTTTYQVGEIPGGTYDATITAMIEDAAGNTRMVSDSVHIDTVASVAFDAAPVEGDNIVSAAEQADGVTITGTSEAGTTSVMVTMGNITRGASVDANGNWSVDFANAELPEGEYLQQMTATATDAAGNTAFVNDSFNVDNYVNELSANGPIEGDDIVSAAEAADGIVMSGRVEAGSSVSVSFGTVTQAAVVDAAGNWSTTFAAGDIAQGEYTAEVTINATDAVGNTASITDTFDVDTTAPGAPVITSFTRVAGDGAVRRIGTLGEEDGYQIQAVDASGNVTNVQFTASSPFSGETEFTFSTAVPDGSQLVVTAEDSVGNENSTLFVFDESGSNVVNATNGGLDGFNIGAIDLQLAESSELTLTADDLEGLSTNGNELTIYGGNDDTVTISGATASGTTTIDGNTYDIYSLGDEGGSLIIQEDITVII